MLKYLIALFALIYCVNIIKNSVALMRIKKCIRQCDRFIEAVHSNNYEKIIPEWDNILKTIPVIEEIVYIPSLSERDTFANNCRKIEDIKYSLVNQRNAIVLNLKRSFNPLSTLKSIYLCLIHFLSVLFFGSKDTRHRRTTSVIVVITGIIGYFANLFSAEIKSLIISLFKHFIDKQG